MRNAFIEELVALAEQHPQIALVVGDLGFSVIEPFADRFPDRFINAGVAEQNMTGLAAGMASEGYHVFTYSIANFPTFRCAEQIRNDVAYHNLPVTVVGWPTARWAIRTTQCRITRYCARSPTC
jgi:transketolase